MHDPTPPAFIPPTRMPEPVRLAAAPVAAIERTPRAELAFIPPAVWRAYLDAWLAQSLQRAA